MARNIWRTRACGALAWALVALTLPGCSSWTVTHLTEPAPQKGTPPARSEAIKIRKADGQKLTLNDWIVDGDTLRGTREVWIDYAPVQKPEAIALRDVTLQNGRLEGENLRRFLVARQGEATPVRKPEVRPVALPKQVRVTLANGSKFELERVTVDGDSLRGQVTWASGTHTEAAFALTDVQTITARHTDVPSTVLLCLATGGAGLLLLIIAGASQNK